MRGRRALTVRIVAGTGVVAALAMGLMAPTPRLLAQKAEPPQGAPTTPEAPPAKDAEKAAKEADKATVSPPTPSDPEPPRPSDPAPAAEPSSPAARLADGTLSDPEAAVQAFVERSQKEADQAINVLGQEAETLRARLRKVEAGLSRWQAVKDSLGATDPTRAGWKGRSAREAGTRELQDEATILPPGSTSGGAPLPPARTRGVDSVGPSPDGAPPAPDDNPKPSSRPTKPPATDPAAEGAPPKSASRPTASAGRVG